jgi:hypothetical protein
MCIFITGAFAMLTQSYYKSPAHARSGVAPSLQATDLGFASALALLSQFKQHMAADGVAVNTQRMRSDSAYACAQLALAHTSNSAPLRQCAMRAFALFHQ